MDEVKEVLSISRKLSEDIKNYDFFPTEKNEFKILLSESKNDFHDYFKNKIDKLDTELDFNLFVPQIKTKKTFVMEIGGTKTTYQIVNVNTSTTRTINPITETTTLPTISPPEKEKVSVDDFISWISDIIKTNLNDCENIAINIATAVGHSGNILFTPPNIYVENMKGLNLSKELSKYIKSVPIHVFNDIESLTALQTLSYIKNSYSIFTDINGTGTNDALYTNNNKIKYLESGHTPCVKIGNKKEELEYATGGKLGIERGFNSLLKALKKDDKYYDVYETYKYAFYKTYEEELSNIALLVFEKMCLYKAISFIAIEEYYKKKKLTGKLPSYFVLFGGLNKLEQVQRGIQRYLDFYNSDITIGYTINGEDAGRFGAAILSSCLD